MPTPNLSEETLFLPVTDLAARLHSRRLSPVALTEAYLARIDELDPAYHAWVTVMRDSALAEAKQAEREIARGRIRGPLHGIPYGAKDLVATKGTRTTWGAKPYEQQSFDYDAAVIRKLRGAGAILLGKLAMIEMAGGLGYEKGTASLTGAARNPWDPSRWTCGSSSGSGAAVGTGMLPFAIGSETWGSIVCPSAFCGITGLRPTFGRISRQGAMALSWTLDKLGPMGRTARDCEVVYRVLSGRDPDDPYTTDEPLGPESSSAGAQRLKVGFLRLDFKKSGNPSVEHAFMKALDDLRGAGVAAEETRLPELPFEAATAVILTSEVATAYEDLQRGDKVRQLSSPGAALAFVTAHAVRGSDYVKAERLRTVCVRAMADLFSKYDVILYPTEMHTAFGYDQDFSGVSWSDPAGGAGNLCGLPAVSVPCGFADDGLPAGLGVLAGAYDEAKAVTLARHYQSITSWHTRRPPVTSART
ncbi:MAG TPA: amidase [Candidatus Polarisedimenticolia bacterium]|nr:amidase [Candidatus Polarisedimenticolia bacterium]